MDPKQLRHSPHRGPAALATASAGDMLPADDSVDRDWRWGTKGQRKKQILLASITSIPQNQENLSTC